MAKYFLEESEKSDILNCFLKKPSFLSSKDEKKLIDFIKSNKLSDFYDYASKLIQNTRDVTNLYTYLVDKLESQNLSNQEIKNHACRRLFNFSHVGWLGVNDPEIIEYCKKNTTDNDLLKELQGVESVKWFKRYIEFLYVEEHISNNFENIENYVKIYHEFITNLLESEKIDQDKYDEVVANLKRETSIYKGGQIIGSLISKKLQEKLGFKTIVPKLSISKSDSNLLLRKD